MPVTQKQLGKCPRCNSTNIAYGENIYEGDISREVDCWDCDFVWWEIYEFAYNEIPEIEKDWSG